jgi:hypothetical protein
MSKKQEIEAPTQEQAREANSILDGLAKESNPTTLADSMVGNSDLNKLNAYIKALEHSVELAKENLEQTPVVALFDIVGEHGTSFAMTVRGFTLLQVFKEIEVGMAQLTAHYPSLSIKKMERMGAPVSAPVDPSIVSSAKMMAPPPPQELAPPQQSAKPVMAPAQSQQAKQEPQYVNADETSRYKVEAVFVDVTQAGVRYLRVRCGPYKKFGVAAYPEVIPDFIDLDGYNLKQDMLPPDEMAFVDVLEGDKKKVVRFVAKE